jgi:SNF2 family DNA or RNA helicase
MKKRKEILDKFRSSARPDGARVLILSGVGMVGLNLACANIMVVMVGVFLWVLVF